MPRKIWVDVHDMGRRRERWQDHIVIGLWGPRGGKLSNVPIDLEQARNLRDALIDAIGKLEYQIVAGFNERIAELGEGER